MDDSHQPPPACSLPLQGPHRPDTETGWDPAAFVPLRLVLRPSGTSVEVTCPDVLVGRHSDADIRLSLPDVSRRHCRLVFAADRWQIFDLNSLNGLFVNGERVRQASLDAGDLVRIGGLTFAVELGQPEAEAGAAQRKAS